MSPSALARLTVTLSLRTASTVQVAVFPVPTHRIVSLATALTGSTRESVPKYAHRPAMKRTLLPLENCVKCVRPHVSHAPVRPVVPVVSRTMCSMERFVS